MSNSIFTKRASQIFAFAYCTSAVQVEVRKEAIAGYKRLRSRETYRKQQPAWPSTAPSLAVDPGGGACSTQQSNRRKG